MHQLYGWILKTSNNTLKVHIHQGNNALILLDDPQFQQDWEALYRQCTWATGFQSPNYASIWYKIYRHHLDPLIFTGYDSNCRLSGLLTLAYSPAEKRLLGAGDRQAEYHAWLTPPDQENTFILEVLNRLDQVYSGVPLVLKYLPPGTPVGWLKKNRGQVIKRCELEPFKRNFLRLDDEEKVDTYVRSKKRLKTKMNKLKRTGEVRFQRIIDRTEFEEALDEIIPLFDFRQGAINGATPFRSNPQKLDFFLELIEKSNLHVTVLTVDGSVTSAFISLYGHDIFPLGEIVHSAFMHKFSPGALHLLMIVPMLAAEGFKEFDLTPGGEAYKDSMASGSDTVYALTVHGTRRQQIIRRIKKRLKSLVQDILRKLPDEGKGFKRIVRACVAAAARINLTNILSARGQKSAEYYIYSLPATQVKQKHFSRFSKDNVADLLLFEPSEGGEAAWLTFLSDCWHLIHKGAHVYTATENNHLVQVAWMLENPKNVYLPETGQALELPDGAAWFFGFYNSSPEHRQSELCRHCLNVMLADVLANNPEIKTYYLGVSEQDTAVRRSAEQSGFTLEKRVLSRIR